MNKLYIHYGCGLSAPEQWQNYDASPTLKLQRLPLIGFVFRKVLKPIFPFNIKYGDITKGLPNVKENSADGIYCSHVLEHLAYDEMIKAIDNTYLMLKPGGTFRLVMPDLENLISSYISRKNNNDHEAAIVFMRNTGMGLVKREKGIKAIFAEVFGNSRHQWLWDYESTKKVLENAGFRNIRKCKFNDSKDKLFALVENPQRFNGALCLEVIK